MGNKHVYEQQEIGERPDNAWIPSAESWKRHFEIIAMPLQQQHAHAKTKQKKLKKLFYVTYIEDSKKKEVYGVIIHEIAPKINA